MEQQLLSACVLTIWAHLHLYTRRNAVLAETALQSAEMLMIIKIFVHRSRVVICVALRTSGSNVVKHVEMLTKYILKFIIL